MRPSLALIGIKGLPFVYSGYETFARELCARLKDRYEIHVYCHRALFTERPSMWEGLHLHYLPAIEHPLLTSVTHGLTSTMHALVRGYDLYLYVNSVHGPFGHLLRLFRKRTVINTDGLEWRRTQLQGAAARYYHWASKQAAKSFDTLVSDSHAMADVYRHEFGADSETIAYGANLTVLSDPHALRRFGLEEKSYYLVLGRLIPDNNGRLILDGFRKSKTRRKLVIIGDLLFRDAYAEAMFREASDRVVFTGFVREPEAVRALCAGAHAYLHGHEFGGTNPALLEALASGTCVLALDTVFNREVLEGDRHGLYFKKDPESLAALLDRIEREPLLVEAARARARPRIEAAYTWEKIAAEYDRLFQKMLSPEREITEVDEKAPRRAVPGRR